MLLSDLGCHPLLCSDTYGWCSYLKMVSTRVHTNSTWLYITPLSLICICLGVNTLKAPHCHYCSLLWHPEVLHGAVHMYIVHNAFFSPHCLVHLNMETTRNVPTLLYISILCCMFQQLLNCCHFSTHTFCKNMCSVERSDSFFKPWIEIGASKSRLQQTQHLFLVLWRLFSI